MIKQAVILAGGRGTRLNPITNNIPKPMVQVNEEPFLKLIVDYLKSQGITQILMLVGYKAGIIQSFFGNGKEFGMDIKYSVEEQLLGTAGALKKAKCLLDDDFILVNGDTFLFEDLTSIIDYYDSQDGVVMVTCVARNDLIGNVSIDKNLVINGYNKSPLVKHKFIDAGFYIMSKTTLENVEDGVFSSLEYDVFNKLIKNKQLCAYKSKERFYDIGTIEDLNLFREIME